VPKKGLVAHFFIAKKGTAKAEANKKLEIARLLPISTGYRAANAMCRRMASTLFQETIMANALSVSGATAATPHTTNTSNTTNTASTAAPVSAEQQNRARLNTSIMQASLSVAISSKNQPQALLFSSAINGINEALKPQLGDNAIQNAAASQDNSAQATADRIVSGATGLFAAFKAQHPDETGDAALKDFMSTIRGGFEQGFGEAASILGGLGVLDGNISAGINQTHDLVEQGFDAFEKANMSTPSDSAPADSGTAAGGAS
jgi:hypothetical protein